MNRTQRSWFLAWLLVIGTVWPQAVGALCLCEQVGSDHAVVVSEASPGEAGCCKSARAIACPDDDDAAQPWAPFDDDCEQQDGCACLDLCCAALAPVFLAGATGSALGAIQVAQYVRLGRSAPLSFDLWDDIARPPNS